MNSGSFASVVVPMLYMRVDVISTYSSMISRKCKESEGGGRKRERYQNLLQLIIGNVDQFLAVVFGDYELDVDGCVSLGFLCISRPSIHHLEASEWLHPQRQQ